MTLPESDPAPSLVADALVYAKRGWPVLPLTGKVPRVKGGVHAATTDSEMIRGWWKRWPSANVGVACGPGSFDVLDVDGPTGEAMLRELVARYGPLPETREHGTGRGRHLLFAPSGLPCLTGKLGPGLDTKGSGGYVVAPPSIHGSGKRYVVTRDASLALAPPWLVALLRGEDPLAVAVAAVAGAPEGRRNETLNGETFRATKGAASESEAAEAAALLRAASTLPAAEAKRTTDSALRAGLEVARRHRELFRRIPFMMTREPWFRGRSPEAKLLVLLLCSGEGGTAIPGVAVLSLAALSKEASLTLTATRRALRELSKRGVLRSDLRAGLLWMPTVTERFRPQSPNMARAWRNALDLGIPRCPLGREVEHAIFGHSGALSPTSSKRALKNASHKEEGSTSPVALPLFPSSEEASL